MIERKSLKAKLSDEDKAVSKASRRANKLKSLRSDFEERKIEDFDQVFAIMSETSLSAELRISFYTFRKKVYAPGEFTVSEIMRFSELLGVEFQVILDFILERVLEKDNKNKRQCSAIQAKGIQRS